MSLRVLLRRALPGAAVATIASLVASAAPALATGGGVVSTFTSTPASTTAGGDPNITASLAFDYTGKPVGDSVKNITVTLPPGLLASIANVPATCSTSQLTTFTCPAASKIGAGTATTTPGVGGAVTAALFLMPAASSADLAGIGAVLSVGPLPVLSVTGALDFGGSISSPVGVLKVSNLPNNVSSIPVVLNSMTLTINGTASGGAPFTRLPTACGSATTTLSVDTYSTATDGTGTDSFMPTGCGSLPYTPAFAATAVKDAGDSGVAFTTAVAQSNALSQAASKSVSLTVPTTFLAPNTNLLTLACANSDPATCPSSATVGTVTAHTPLLSQALTGRVVVVKGSGLLPGLTIVLTTPVTVELPGIVTAAPSGLSTTFSTVPDIPLKDLIVALTGGPNAAFTTTCAQRSASISGVFTGQNGKSANLAAPVTISGCPTGGGTTPGAPTISPGSLTGLAKGKPKLSFTLTAGSNAPKLSSFSMSLPSGLSLISKKVNKGLKLGGASVKSAKVSHGKLVVTLKSAAGSVAVTLGSKALKVSKGLLKKAKKHKLGTPTAKVTVADAAGKSTKLTLAFATLS